MAREDLILYRAVKQAELEEIRATGSYTMAQGVNGKYFYPTIEQARSFVKKDWAQVITSASFSADMLELAYEDTAASEGAYLFLPGELFPHGPVTIEDAD